MKKRWKVNPVGLSKEGSLDGRLERLPGVVREMVSKNVSRLTGEMRRINSFELKISEKSKIAVPPTESALASGKKSSQQ